MTLSLQGRLKVKINSETEKKRFDCPNVEVDDVIETRKSLHWLELGNEVLDIICVCSTERHNMLPKYRILQEGLDIVLAA